MYDFEYDAQGATILTLIMQTRDAITQVSKRYLSKVGLSPEKYHVLLLCLNSPDPVTIGDLSRMLFRKPHSVSGLLNRMEAEGLLYRDRAGPQDEQGPMSIVVTDQGADTYKRANEVFTGPMARCIERCSQEELDQTEVGLRALRNSLLTELNIESQKMSLRSLV